MQKIRNFFLNYKNIFLGQISSIISFVISTILLFLNLYFLSVEDRGVYGLVYTLPSLLIIFTDFGITPILIRYVSRNYNLDVILPSLLLVHIFRVIFTVIIGSIIIKFAGYYLYNVQDEFLYLALPIIFSSSANSFLTPYFYGTNRITIYYVLLILPNFLILMFSLLLVAFNEFNLVNVINSSLYIYIFHSIVVVVVFIIYSGTYNLSYNKKFNYILKESKFLYTSNILTFGYIYIFPIIINKEFGIINLSYVLFCIAISDKLFLIGDSVGYEIIRKINLNLSEEINLKFGYFYKVLFFMIPVILFSALMIFLITKFVLLDHFFFKYKPVLTFFLFVLFQYFCQSIQRIILQFYNGLGRSNFAFSISFVSVFIKLLILLLFSVSLSHTLILLGTIDLFVVSFLLYMIKLKNINNFYAIK